MKIKQIAKYLLPIVIVVGIVVAFLLSRMSKSTGRDNVLTGDVELPQDQEGNYISQRYESNLIPNDTGFSVNDQPVDNVIRVDDGESGDDSDYIYIEIADTDIKDLYKKEDLLDGHPTTDHTTQLTTSLLESKEIVELDENYINEATIFTGLPSEMAYDTQIITRTLDNTEVYIGMLYGKWLYFLEPSLKEQYKLTTELVIASYYSDIVLEELYSEGQNCQIILSDGQILEDWYIE